MRTNIKALLPVLAALTLVSGCTGDYSPEESGKPTFREPGAGKGNYVSFAIDLSDGGYGTRAVSEDTGADNERMVEAIRIVFYDSQTEEVADVWDVKAKNISAGGGLSPFYGEDVSDEVTPTEALFVAKGHHIEGGDYKVLAIINPSADILALTGDVNDLDDIRLKVYESDDLAADLTGGAAHNRFLMLNYQGEVDVSQRHDFYETSEEAERYPVSIGVERAVAKISVQINREVIDITPPVIPPAPAPVRSEVYTTFSFPLELTDMTWNASVLNRHSYLLRQPASKRNASQERKGDTDRENFYAIDPNYEGYAGSGAGILSREFRYATDADLNREVRNYDSDRGFYDMYDNDEESADFIYIPENTMDVGDQRHNLATHLVFKAYFNNGHYTYDDNWEVVEDDGPEHFFILYDYAYTYYDREAFYEGTIVPWQAVVNYINTGEFDWSYLDSQWYSSRNLITALDDAIAIHGITGNVEDWENIEPFTIEYPHRLFKFAFFKDGVGYYSVPVRHFGQNELWQHGKYGVVRNNIYRIVIGDIRWPDSNTLPIGPQYDEPLEPVPYASRRMGLDVVIAVRDWNNNDIPTIFDLPTALPRVEIGRQNGYLYAGEEGTVTFPVMTHNVADGTYDIIFTSSLPQGITMRGDLVISSNSGTLTFDADGTILQGGTDLRLYLAGTLSSTFALIVNR
jgi:hypothetical protein